MKKMFILLKVFGFCIFFSLLFCCKPEPEQEVILPSVADIELNKWVICNTATDFDNDIQIEEYYTWNYHFIGSGKYEIRVAGKESENYMFDETKPDIWIYSGPDKTELISKFNDSWKTAAEITVDKNTDIYIELRSTKKNLFFAMRVSDESHPLELTDFSFRPTIEFDGEVSITANPSSHFSNQKEIKFGCTPDRVIAVYTFDGSEPDLSKNLHSKDYVKTGTGIGSEGEINKFDVEMKMGGIYFDKNSAVIQRNYSFDSLILGNVPHNLEFSNNNTLSVKHTIYDIYGGYVDTGSFIFNNAGTFNLSGTASYLSTFTYTVVVDGVAGESHGITNDGVNLSVDTNTKVEIEVTQGSYYGQDVKFSIDANFKY